MRGVTLQQTISSSLGSNNRWGIVCVDGGTERRKYWSDSVR